MESDLAKLRARATVRRRVAWTFDRLFGEWVWDTINFACWRWTQKKRINWMINLNTEGPFVPGEFDFTTTLWHSYTQSKGYDLTSLVAKVREELDYGALHAAIALLGLYYYARNNGRRVSEEVDFEAARLVTMIREAMHRERQEAYDVQPENTWRSLLKPRRRHT